MNPTLPTAPTRPRPPLANHERFFLGTNTVARPDWDDFFVPPTATRSSKPDSVEREIAEKRADREARSPRLPVAGTLVHAVVLDSDGNQLVELRQNPAYEAGEASFRLLEFLTSAMGGPTNFVSINPPGIDVQVRLFGFFIKDRIRLIALDAMRFLAITKIEVDLPVGLWYHRPFEPAPWCDPYDAIVPSDMRNDISQDSICDFLGIPVPEVALDYDPVAQAELARQLAIKAQLFPRPGWIGRLVG